MSRFLDSSWHRVAELKPRLADTVQIQAHRYRKQPWYVLLDPVSGRSYRLTPETCQLIRQFDGEHSVDQIWQSAVEHFGQNAPGQADFIQLLGQLHGGDLLKCDVAPDSAELLSLFGRQSRILWINNLRNPMSIRLPLWNPDGFLQKTLPFVRPAFTRAGFAVWLAWVVMGIVLAAEHWQSLTENLTDRLFAAHNLLILWLVYPLVKWLHEMGHAYATRVQGGEVHEMGIMVLVGMLVPYVDAGASSAFRNKWHRALVGSAGMMVELALAATAMLFWTWLEPGVLRSCLFNVLWIASVSTVVFNGNPLMLYDGYYILSDLLEIPNLSLRGLQYWRFLVNRHAFGILKPERFDATLGECRWFLIYTPLSYVYRLIVMFGIALYLAENLFVIGVLLALWTGFTQLVMPIGKGIVYLASNPSLNATRSRAIWLSLGFVASMAVALGLIPVPMRTQYEGVVWLSPQAEVRAGGSGFVHRLLLPSGSPVAAGDVLVECEDPVLLAEIEVNRAKIAEIKARRMAEWREDRNQAEILREELAGAEADLQRALVRQDQLSIRSRTLGRFFVDREADLPGRFLHQGDLIGFVVDGSQDIIRIVVPQEDIDLVRYNVKSILVRLSEQPDRIIPARLIREVPSAEHELPSMALSTEGGGKQELDPKDRDHTKALARLFQFDVQLLNNTNVNQQKTDILPYGTRAYVRFTHQAEPVAMQAWRRLRQLFLSRLAV